MSATAAAEGVTEWSFVSAEFSVRCSTFPSASVLVSGSVPELGLWDVSRALRLEWTPGGLWTARVALSRVPAFCFKYLLIDEGHPRWEVGADRFAQAKEAGEHARFADTWRDRYDAVVHKGGALFSWGCDKHQQLGRAHPRHERSHQPQIVDRLSQSLIVKIACGGERSLLLDDKGVVYRCGGFQGRTSIPRPVVGLREHVVKAIAANAFDSLAITQDGAVYHWSEIDIDSPRFHSSTCQLVRFPENSPAVQVSCGAGFFLALLANGMAFSWGVNGAGQLGLGDTEDRAEPVHVEALGRTVQSLACGSHMSMFLTSAGFFTCGANRYGELGLGHQKETIATPQRVEAFEPGDVISFSSAEFVTTAVTASGVVYAWGRAEDCGRPEGSPNVDVPQRVDYDFGAKVTSVSTGGAFGATHVAFVTDAGSLYMMGDNRYGQCGVPVHKADKVATPTHVEVHGPVDQVSCGWLHTVALTRPLGRLPLLPTPLGHFDKLPNRLVFSVLSHLAAPELVSLACCSSTWRELTSSGALWQQLCARDGVEIDIEATDPVDDLLSMSPLFSKYPRWKIAYLRHYFHPWMARKENELIKSLEEARNYKVCQTWFRACTATDRTPLLSPMVNKLEAQSTHEEGLPPISLYDTTEEMLVASAYCSPPSLLRRLSRPGERDWYKDAVFYEVFVRAFKDSNGDGSGDLRGLTSKLDYLKDLGINVVWLLPITKSPLRDHGYDVSDYYSAHPDYGSIEDFQELVIEAHKRGIRVMVELVPNHTSCDHEWFVASHDTGHADHDVYRDYYIWSDTDTPFALARIIFRDYEVSNWTWDAKRRAFYYHRFFYHQPDLNYDNVDVQAAILEVIRFWIDQGIDAVRVDAPPYLFKREGTNCENLPETHAFFKRLRRLVDIEAPEVMLLSEANQWPEDVVKYFGQGDEFDMNFHFPLMPRIFMALAKKDRTPIDRILEMTPALPPNGQWGTFLRNHDELTLEMVTDEDRQFLWNHYAPNTRMRLNLGIRRRLAPLLDNDPAKITLAHSILLTIIGSPFLYYGDEIGMGDDISLDDRSGVRTPMQWDATANAGFSTSEPNKLYLPPIAQGPYDYRRVNVAAQRTRPHSILNWLRAALRIRRHHRAFGRGHLLLLDAGCDAVLAYARWTPSETVVVANNLGDAVVAPIDVGELARRCAGLHGAGAVEVRDLFAHRTVAIANARSAEPLRLLIPRHGHVWLQLSLEEIANTVAVALELSISQAEQLASELALMAEASPGACSDDPNVSSAVVQGSWRDLFSMLLLPERAGWAIVSADSNDVVINTANGTIDIGALKSTTPSFNVFTRPWYTAAMASPGRLVWGRFYIGIPAGRQLMAVSRSHGSLKNRSRLCGMRGVLMSMVGWQQFLKAQMASRDEKVWLIEADTGLLFSTSVDVPLFVGNTAQRVFANSSTNKHTREVGMWMTRITAGGERPPISVGVITIEGRRFSVLARLMAEQCDAREVVRVYVRIGDDGVETVLDMPHCSTVGDLKQAVRYGHEFVMRLPAAALRTPFCHWALVCESGSTGLSREANWLQEIHSGQHYVLKYTGPQDLSSKYVPMNGLVSFQRVLQLWEEWYPVTLAGRTKTLRCCDITLGDDVEEYEDAYLSSYASDLSDFKIFLEALVVAKRIIVILVFAAAMPSGAQQPRATTAPCDGRPLEEIANTVAVALELSISQAEQLTSELALVAEASPGACSDDPNVSSAVVQGSWRGLFSMLLLPERAGWAIVSADSNDVVINTANGTIDIGALKSTTPSFNVFTRPWYTAAMARPGRLVWGRFYIGIPAGRQLMAVSRSHGSLKNRSRLCGMRGVLMSMVGWQQFLKAQMASRDEKVWLIEADTGLLFSTNVVVINTANGTLDIGPLKSISATFSVFTFPCKLCGVRGVIISMAGWQQFLKALMSSRTESVWLIEADTGLLFSTTVDTPLSNKETLERVSANSSSDRQTREVGLFVSLSLPEESGHRA
eukprot:m51a1_g10673 putative trehalose synthase (1978) ;mRNA; r:31871-42139